MLGERYSLFNVTVHLAILNLVIEHNRFRTRSDCYA